MKRACGYAPGSLVSLESVIHKPSPRGVGTRSFRQPTCFISDYRTQKKTAKNTSEDFWRHKCKEKDTSFCGFKPLFFLHNLNVSTVWDPQWTWNLVTIVQLNHQNQPGASGCDLAFYWSNMSKEVINTDMYMDQISHLFQPSMFLQWTVIYIRRSHVAQMSTVSGKNRNFQGLWLHL